MTKDGEQRDPLEAGLKAGYSPDSQAPGESVLAAIERLHGSDARSQVALRHIEEGGTPVALMRDDGPAVDDSRYQVLGEIARGGVGVIYRGRDKDLNREVALKVLKADHADNPDVVQRFIEEAQVGGQLHHPGIVPIYGMGLQSDGRAYFAMKLIKGRTLSAMLESNPAGIDLPSVFESIAQTMAYAHSRGVIHRDLKPANIMIGAFGEVMVVDWGFAKVLGLDDTAPTAPKNTVIATVRSEAEGSQSIAGSVMGTPAYMPPEQALGHVDELDERSDVFALGAILCEILTGEAPYTGNLRDQLLAASQCRLEEANERLDNCDAADELKQLARDCMQPLGKKRPAEAGVVASRVSGHFAAVEERVRNAELRAIEAEAAADRSRRARKQTLALTSLALVAILGSGGGYLWWRGERDARRKGAEQRVAAALAKAAQRERSGDRTAAISAAQEAVGIAETEQTAVDEARATVARLKRRQKEAEHVAFVEFRNQQLQRNLESIFYSPPDEIRKTLDRDCRAVLAAHFGTGESAWKRAERRLEGSSVAAAIASSLLVWAGYVDAEAKKPLHRLAFAIDPTQLNLRQAVIDKDPEAVQKELQAQPLKAIPVRLIKSAGWILWNVGRRDQTETLFRAAAQLHPGSAEIQSALGWMYARSHRVEDAVRHFTVAVAARPKIKHIRHGYAQALERAGQLESAVEAWREVLEVHPRWAHGMGHLLSALNKLKRFDEAETIARNAVRADPTSDMLVRVLSAQRQYAAMLTEARRVLRASLAATPSMADVELGGRYSWVGYAHLCNGEHEQAIPHYLRARELGPKELTTWDGLIGAYLVLDDPDSAFEVLCAALEDPKRRVLMWRRFRERANATIRQALIDLARRYLKLHPKDTSGWYTVGRRHKNAGQLDLAIDAMRTATGLSESANGWQWLATVHQQRAAPDDLAQAEEAIERALAIKRNVYALHFLARLKSGQDKHEEAEALNKEAVELEPWNGTAVQRYIESLHRREDFKTALQVTRGYYRRNKNLRTLSEAAWHLRALKDPQAAIRELRVLETVKAHASDKQARWAWRELGMARIEAGQPDGAEALTRSIELGLNDNWWELGLELSKHHAPDVVREKLRALVDRTVYPESAWFALLKTYLSMGDFDSALQVAKQTSSLTFPRARTHYVLGMIFTKTARAGEALVELDAVDPKFVESLIKGEWETRKAAALFRLGRYGEAVALLDSAGLHEQDKDRRRRATLVPRLPAIVAGEDTAKDATEAYDFGVALATVGLADDKKTYSAAAVAMFKKAKTKGGQLWLAARAASHAHDLVTALAWSREWLDYVEDSKNVMYVRLVLERAARDPRSKSVRDAGNWPAFWTRFDGLLAKARKQTW